VVNLAQYANLIEDLISAFGVAKLSTLDSHSSTILKKALVNFTIASNTKKSVTGEVVCGFLYLFATEKFSGSSPISGIENSFTLFG